jgi:hypothetical protein
MAARLVVEVGGALRTAEPSPWGPDTSRDGGPPFNEGRG